MRLAEGPVRSLVAGRARRHARDAAVEGPREVQARHGGDVDDEEARHRRVDESLRRAVRRGRVESPAPAPSVSGEVAAEYGPRPLGLGDHVIARSLGAGAKLVDVEAHELALPFLQPAADEDGVDVAR